MSSLPFIRVCVVLEVKNGDSVCRLYGSYMCCPGSEEREQECRLYVSYVFCPRSGERGQCVSPRVHHVGCVSDCGRRTRLIVCG